MYLNKQFINYVRGIIVIFDVALPAFNASVQLHNFFGGVPILEVFYWYGYGRILIRIVNKEFYYFHASFKRYRSFSCTILRKKIFFYKSKFT